MIQSFTRLTVADNSGAEELMYIKVLGGGKRRYATVGSVTVVSVRKALPNGRVEKDQIVKVVTVRTKKGIHRDNSSLIRFDEDAAVTPDNKREPIGTRIFGSVGREARYGGFMKIISLAPEVL